MLGHLYYCVAVGQLTANRREAIALGNGSATQAREQTAPADASLGSCEGVFCLSPPSAAASVQGRLERSRHLQLSSPTSQNPSCSRFGLIHHPTAHSPPEFGVDAERED